MYQRITPVMGVRYITSLTLNLHNGTSVSMVYVYGLGRKTSTKIDLAYHNPYLKDPGLSIPWVYLACTSDSPSYPNYPVLVL